MKKIFCFLLVALSVLALFAGCGSKGKSVKEFIDVEFATPYDGYAKAELKVDEEGLNALLDSKTVLKFLKEYAKKAGANGDEYTLSIAWFEEHPEDLPKFDDLFDVYIDGKSTKLENGDVVTVKIEAESDLLGAFKSTQNVAKKLGLSIPSETIEFKVKDLGEFESVSIDLGKLFVVDFGKYDGYSTPTVSIDGEYLENNIISELLDEYAGSVSGSIGNLLYGDAEDWFTASFDKSYNNIKNGDKITVVLGLSEVLKNAGATLDGIASGLKLNFNGGSKEFTVSGLEEAKNVLDIFFDVENYIPYTGANGYGRISYTGIEIPKDYSKQIGDLYLSRGGYTNSIQVVHNNKRVAQITYHVNGENLKKGDVIEIRAELDPRDLEALGYLIPSTKKNVTVPDLGEYVTSKSQLTSAVIDSIKSVAAGSRKVDGVHKIYYVTYKPGVVCSFNSTSFIVVITHRTGLLGGYCIDELNDVVVKADGSVEVSNYKEGYSYNSIDIAISKFDHTRYEFEEIK